MNGVFVDSNVILRHLGGDVRAKRIVDLVESGEFKGYVNQVVVSEVLYVYVKLVTGMKSYELKKKPEVVKQVDLKHVFKLLSLFEELPSSFEITRIAEEMIRGYGFLPNDAIIVATCKYYGIGKIATFDDDFKRVDFLEIVRF